MTEGIAAIQSGNGKTGTGQEDKIFSLIFDGDEITWQSIIYDLIKTEQMDPWDIDVSIIAEKFISMLDKMQKMDFRISGKIIVAAAFFLKIKSDKLLKEDIAFLDNMINPTENPDEMLGMLGDLQGLPREKLARAALELKSPQPRRRKVSVYDLINALERAMAFEQKRSFFKTPKKIKINLPDKQKPITQIINEVYERIKKTIGNAKHIKFSDITTGERKEDKIMTFVPLLYLDTQRKIDLNQQQHLGEIIINLAKPKATPLPESN